MALLELNGDRADCNDAGRCTTAVGARRRTASSAPSRVEEKRREEKRREEKRRGLGRGLTVRGRRRDCCPPWSEGPRHRSPCSRAAQARRHAGAGGGGGGGGAAAGGPQEQEQQQAREANDTKKTWRYLSVLSGRESAEGERSGREQSRREAQEACSATHGGGGGGGGGGGDGDAQRGDAQRGWVAGSD